MKKITFTVTMITLITTASAFALPIITVTNQAAPFQNQTGYLQITVSAFSPCTFTSTTPIKVGSNYSVDFNDVTKYQQFGSHCTQKNINDKLNRGYTRYIASVYYPALKLQAACEPALIKKHLVTVDSTIVGYLPSNHFRAKGIPVCAYSRNPPAKK